MKCNAEDYNRIALDRTVRQITTDKLHNGKDSNIVLCSMGFAICLILICCFTRLSAFGEEPKYEIHFDGSSYMTYKIANKILSRQPHIHFTFQTIKPTGLFLHVGDGKSKFMTVELYRGRLR